MMSTCLQAGNLSFSPHSDSTSYTLKQVDYVINIKIRRAFLLVSAFCKGILFILIMFRINLVQLTIADYVARRLRQLGNTNKIVVVIQNIAECC